MLLVTIGKKISDARASLVVYCIQYSEPRPLFCIKSNISSTRLHAANMGMSCGFVAFTCDEFDLVEVWRWAEDQTKEPRDRTPSPHQVEIYEDAMESMNYQIGSNARRGELVPMGTLKQSASYDGDLLWLWDIRSRELIQTINIEPSPYSPFRLFRLDVNEAYVSVANHTVSVYSRASGNCVFQLPNSLSEICAPCMAPPLRIRQPESAFQTYELQTCCAPRCAPGQDHYQPISFANTITGIQVSPTGNDIVAITLTGFLLHLGGLKSNASEYEQPAQSTESPAGSSSLESFKVSVVRAGRSLKRLAYDGHRILVSGEQGLTVINLESQLPTAFQTTYRNVAIQWHPFPARLLNRVPHFGKGDGMCICMQLTQNRFWFTRPLSNHVEPGNPSSRRWHQAMGMMDFAQEGSDDSDLDLSDSEAPVTQWLNLGV